MDVDVVAMVKVVVTAEVAVMAGGAIIVQEGLVAAPAGAEVTAQLRATVPVNPPTGVTEIVEVAEAPAVIFAIAVELSEKPAVSVGEAATRTPRVWTYAPEESVPVTRILASPAMVPLV